MLPCTLQDEAKEERQSKMFGTAAQMLQLGNQVAGRHDTMRMAIYREYFHAETQQDRTASRRFAMTVADTSAPHDILRQVMTERHSLFAFTSNIPSMPGDQLTGLPCKGH